jgi:hypothetical protein
MLRPGCPTTPQKQCRQSNCCMIQITFVLFKHNPAEGQNQKDIFADTLINDY